MTRQEFIEAIPFRDGDRAFFVIEHNDRDEQGRICSERMCIGFNSFELLGRLTDLQLSVHRQINGMEEPVHVAKKEWHE